MDVIFEGNTQTSKLLFYKEKGEIGYHLQIAEDGFESEIGNVYTSKYDSKYDFIRDYLGTHLHSILPVAISETYYDFFHEELNKLLLKMSSSPAFMDKVERYRSRDQYLGNTSPQEAWTKVLYKSVLSDSGLYFFTKEEMEEKEREARPPKPDIISEYMRLVNEKTQRERTAYLNSSK